MTAESKGTKQVLAQSLKELMNERSFLKISVGDICTHCGMSRKSFYYHFQDKYDLMNWIFYTEFAATLQLPAEISSQQLLLNICSYFHKEQAFYRNALSVNGQNSFQEYFVDVIQPFIHAFVLEMFDESQDIHFFVTFYTDAFLSAIIRWLNEGTPIPPQQFAYLLEKAVGRSSMPALS